jgi:hypothetical protein
MTISLDTDIAENLIAISMDINSRLTKGDNDKLYGFRKQKQLQVLVKGCAMYEGRDFCQQKDIEHIASLSEFIGVDSKATKSL